MTTSIVLDTETTGLDPKVDRICEIAAIAGDRESDREPFSMICNPGRDIPPEAMAIHHIRQHETLGCPSPGEAFIDLLEHFSYPQFIVAHNAKYDKSMLAGIMPPEYKPTFICTMICAQMVWPDAPGYSQQVLRYWLGIEPDLPSDLAPHRALYDVICAREILYRLRDHANPADLVNWSNNLVRLPKMPFGKCKGMRFTDIDYGMLKWIKNNIKDDPNVAYSAEMAIKERYP